MKELLSKNVFIDTSIYVHENFQYLSDKFETLKSHTLQDKIKLYSHEIIIKEIKSNINTEVNEAVKSIKQLNRSGKILWNLSKEKIHTIFSNQNTTRYRDLLFSQLTDFIKSTKTTILSSSLCDVDSIFNNYFDKKPPFGEGKRKDEFPDAFVLSAIENWCKSNNEKIYIMSRDKAWHNCAEDSIYLIAIETIEELLDLISFKYESLADRAAKLLEDNLTDIKEEIKTKFMELGFLIENEDGDINNVLVNTIDIDNYYLINIKTDTSLNSTDVKYELAVTTEYDADAYYGDQSTASYDSEEKRLLIWDYIDKTVTQTEGVTVELEFTFESHHEILDNLFVRITDPRDVWVSVEDEKYPYK
jgi:hypothetical protein